VDEAGFYLLPGPVKTYAPQGLTPVVYEWQTRDHLSVMGAVTTEGRVYSLVRQESLNGLREEEQVAEDEAAPGATGTGGRHGPRGIAPRHPAAIS
jgi:hypothetical protein